MSSFSRLHPRLQRAIVDRLGWRSLRPVQEQATGAILDGKNAIVLAPTAGGKTEASMFPVLSQLVDAGVMLPGALYLAPIKALLNNQEERLEQYAEMVGLRAFKWHGDTSQADRRNWLKDPGELLLTTPESLEVLLVSPRVPTRELFAHVQAIVIDEVHAFAGSDRGAHLLAVIERLSALIGRDVQRIGLSATVGNPDGILAWLSGSSQRGGVVIDPGGPPPKREVLVAVPGPMTAIARDAANLARGQKSLCFAESRAATETISTAMQGGGLEVLVHHSSVSHEERQRAEERFARGSNTCIVCTSTLELGIDVGDLDRVLQVNAPRTVASLLQRIGRTGRRAGRAQSMVFFCETGFDALQASALLTLVQRGWVESVPRPGRMWHVLAHQLLAWTLQHEALDVDAAWTVLQNVDGLRGFNRSDVDRVVAHLERLGMVDRVGPLLVMGTTAERKYGRRNFLELYSVFTSPQMFTVKTVGGRELGSLDEDFVEQLVEDMSSFLLGGSAWQVVGIDRSNRVVTVEPAAYGKKPAWGGHAPILVSLELCSEMKRLLVEAPSLPFLHPTARTAIDDLRQDLGDTLAERGGLRVDQDEIRWWTFAGGRINQTLRLGLTVATGWKVVADNFGLGVRGDGLSLKLLDQHRRALADPAWWLDRGNRAAVLDRLPSYRVSKFQHLLPVDAQQEIIGDMLLDVEGAIRWLRDAATPGDHVPYM